MTSPTINNSGYTYYHLSSIRSQDTTTASSVCCDDGTCGEPENLTMNGQQDPTMKKLEIICSICFAAIGAYMAPIPFAVAFTVGVVYEIVLKTSGQENDGPGINRPGCGQGNGELFAGRKLLKPEVVIVTAALFYEHLEHHPEFFVPFLAFWLGVRSVVHLTPYVTSLVNSYIPRLPWVTV